MMRVHQILMLGALLLASGARAGSAPRRVMRFATIAPDGSAWAREMRALSRDVESGTRGEVGLKWYFGGIAGHDLEMLGRLQRGQLDGVASAGPLCMQVAPSMRVMRLPGLFESRDEAAHVLNRLKPSLDAEFHKAGLVHLISSGLGQEMVFSRRPIRSLAELRATRMWRWDQDEPAHLTDPALGLTTLALPLEEGIAAYDAARVDGFYVIPTAALAFQYHSRAPSFLPLRMGMWWGCLLVTERAWNQLPLEEQNAVRTAAVKFGLRMEEVGRQQEDALVGGQLRKLGVSTQPVSEPFRVEFLSAARQEREQLGDKLVPAALLQQVLALLADYRAEHPGK